MVRWGRRGRWGHDPLGRNPAAVAGIPPDRTVAHHVEVRNRNGGLEVVGYRSMHPDPGGYWHRIDRIGHLAARAESLRVGEDRMSLFSAVDHSLEERRRTATVEDTPGSRNPERALVAGNPGSSLGGIGCMGLFIKEEHHPVAEFLDGAAFHLLRYSLLHEVATLLFSA